LPPDNILRQTTFKDTNAPQKAMINDDSRDTSCVFVTSGLLWVERTVSHPEAY